MKKVLILLSAVCLLSFTADRMFTIKFSEPQLTKHWSNLLTVKQIVGESNLPHQQVKFVENSIDSLLNDMAKQLQPVDTLKKK